MLRIFVALVIIGLVAPLSPADVLILKGRGGDVKIVGIKNKIDEVEVTLDNVKSLIQESTGYVASDDYDGVTLKKSDRATTGQTFPRDEVVEILYKEEPDALLEGLDGMQTGAWAQAISALQEVFDDKEQRAVFRLEAYFQIGICYASMGNLKRAVAHFARWPQSKSKYTPEVHRILAEIHTAQKRFDAAREEYQKIGALDNVPENWKHRAALGAVKVAIAERKYTEAEQAAKRIAGIVSSNGNLADARCLALALQAQAILESANADRLGEAEKLVRDAIALKGVSNTNAAFSYLLLGHVLYAQKRADEARFPYLRVACLYPLERSYVASALQNAGQCFVDLSAHPDNLGKPASDELFMKGMKLLAECGFNYKGTESASKAASTYREHRARYEELKAKAEGGAEEEGSGGGDEDAGSEDGK